MTRKPQFGRSMRNSQWSFAPSFTPVNHGSFGAVPKAIEEKHFSAQRYITSRPDVFIVQKLPVLIDESREALTPLLGVATDEIVLMPNATTGINTVLRNLKFQEGDVIVHFSTIYDSCEKTIASVGEMNGVRGANIPLQYPVEDDEIVRKLRERILQERKEGKNVKLAMFDTVLTFPGARMPWEELTAVCKELGVLSIIDGAHGIGHIDLTHLGQVSPDFFVSNCHKWLYVPRGCAVFYVPFRNQHLLRTSLPTSHSYLYPGQQPDPAGKPRFVNLFDFVATIDYSTYLCIPAAIEYREGLGGEEVIRRYTWDVARQGGERIAEILGTYVMASKSGTMSQCAFSNVRLPLDFEPGCFSPEQAETIQVWINETAVDEFDTYLQVAYHAGSMWVRLSGQVYLEFRDFEWLGHKLKQLCDRLKDNPKLVSA